MPSLEQCSCLSLLTSCGCTWKYCRNGIEWFGEIDFLPLLMNFLLFLSLSLPLLVGFPSMMNPLKNYIFFIHLLICMFSMSLSPYSLNCPNGSQSLKATVLCFKAEWRRIYFSLLLRDRDDKFIGKFYWFGFCFLWVEEVGLLLSWRN